MSLGCTAGLQLRWVLRQIMDSRALSATSTGQPPVPVLWPCSSTDRGQVASQQQQQLAFLKFPFAQLLRAQSLIACTCSQHILVGCTPESQPYVLPQVAVVLTAIKQSDSTFVAIPS